ncbi:hypothetical protein ALQ32_100395 [Pseudomonas syringae pv. tagetis]|uniref:Uncharacterized protein n=1 Tax=Pseudomonas syringae pv. tagetis TaxID=129140 RepID=A0A3M3Z8Z4_9PSED|nr:hypothetical protein [Pseudomonas syringae group genomosp. 7]RMO91177.1 hypothetical protein ALQ32_100395 [Pseudomonas syringae pv. tagetis]
MPHPVSQYSANQAYLYNNQPSHHQASTSRAQQSSQGVHRVARPGNTTAVIGGHSVPLTAVNRTGFASAFATPQTVHTTQLGQRGIAPASAQQVLSQRHRLAHAAELEKQRILNNQLNNFPTEKSRIAYNSLQHFNRCSPAQGRQVVDALHTYQQDYGDNYLMNVSAMGYRSLSHYLQSLDPKYHNEAEVNNFVRDFARHYEAGELNAEEFNIHKTHIETQLAPQTALLRRFIHAAPRISGVSLLKGATGHDDLFTTQLNGESALQALLSGKALRFNGFLSTTSSADAAVEFSSVSDERGLSGARYTVDLTSGDLSSEVLRRQTLRDLQSNRVDASSIFFRFKADHVAGIHVDAIQDAHNPDMSISEAGEQEILLNPGHYFQPEKIVMLEQGFAVSGRLAYGER